MKKSELIEKLKDIPDDWEVKFSDPYEERYKINSVVLYKDEDPSLNVIILNYY